MKILIIGNGAREHAIAEAICRSPERPELYAYMSTKNPGIARLCKDYTIGDILSPDAIAKWAFGKKVDLAVIGPESPLEKGVVDALEGRGIDCAGPTRSGARLESDKSFARELLKKYRIDGNPVYKVLSSSREIDDFLDEIDIEVAIKPAGLTGGKGVRIMGEHLKDKEAAKQYAKEIIEKGIGGINKVVVEEKLIGEEFTIQAFVSPDEILGTPMVQDHKRAYEGDVGPNTGGMGSYTNSSYFLPFLDESDYEFGLKVMRNSMRAFKKETGENYKGFLYGQFIATVNGPKLVEFNARLGDPEAMNILSVMEGSFIQVLQGIVHGGLTDVDISFPNKATVCKYLVPDGYPENPVASAQIEVDEIAIKKSGALVYYAAVDEKGGKIYTTKSRAVALVGVAETIEKAEQIAEKATHFVKGPLEHRRDIGTEELIRKRFEHMKEIRGF